MLDKQLKVFGLDDNFSLEDLEDKYKILLKEFDTENIDDGLKLLFSEEQEKIHESYHILLDYYNRNNDVEDNLNEIKIEGKKNNFLWLIVGIPICVLLMSTIIFFIVNVENLSVLKIENIDNYEIIKNHDPEWDYIRKYDGSYSVRKKSDPPEVWSELSSGKQLEAVKKVFESAEEEKPCECGCEKYKNRRNE